MTRKRFKKLMMSIGYSRNMANWLTGYIAAVRMPGEPWSTPSYEESWRGFHHLWKLRRAHEEWMDAHGS